MGKAGLYIVAFVVLVGLMITFGNRGLWDSYAMQQRLQDIQKSNQTIAEDNASLEKEISLLQSNLPYIEMVARNELGMVKDGDVVFRISR
ncbi:MAG: septum formation initiator family protein [Syntrophobacterales bacterium]|nr:septum formation initiator family protein [Syntrophobacterales bacterium]